MRLLVTGGAGFIGSNFVHHILEKTDHEVVTLDALTYVGSKSNLDGLLDNPRHEFIEGDIRDPTTWTSFSTTPTRSSTSPPSPTSTGRSRAASRSS